MIKVRMDRFFIFLSVIMCIVLIGIQVSRIYPFWREIPEDPFMGEPLQAFRSLVKRGNVVLDVLGRYNLHEAMIYKNGERYLLVEQFPVVVEVMEGDVLEVWVLSELKGSSLIVKSISGNMRLKYSRTSIPLVKGLHRIGKLVPDK